VLGPYVTDLQPDPKRSGWLVVECAGYLKQSLAEEEDQPWILRRPELAIDRESEDVPVETAAALWVGWAQQDTAAEYLHAPIMPWRGPPGTATHMAGRGRRKRHSHMPQSTRAGGPDCGGEALHGGWTQGLAAGAAVDAGVAYADTALPEHDWPNARAWHASVATGLSHRRAGDIGVDLLGQT
jgi:hypothetical protein